MVPVGNHIILWDIRRTYSHHGFKNFILCLCLGYKAEIIKSYVLNYPTMNSDFTIALKMNDVNVHKIEHDEDWHVTLADAGALTMTGACVARAATKYLGEAEHFAVTYGDGLTDADAQRKIGTELGVHPPSRFGGASIGAIRPDRRGARRGSRARQSRRFLRGARSHHGEPPSFANKRKAYLHTT
jgi:glucose-1-phosphate cytidylyltransferase